MAKETLRKRKQCKFEFCYLADASNRDFPSIFPLRLYLYWQGDLILKLFLPVCSAQIFNLVFLVDGSGSIEAQGRGNFQRAKDFIIALVNTFEVGRDKVNVATVLYAAGFSIIHRLNTYYRKEDVVQAIQRMPYPSGGTLTGLGLNAIRSEIFKNLGDRSQLPKVVVVLTDGLSQDSVIEPARRLREIGVTVISIGVGCCFYRPQLNEIASDPDANHVFEVSFTNLPQIQETLRERICFGKGICQLVFHVSI